MLNFLFRGARPRFSRQTPLTRRRSYVPRLDVLEDRSLPSTLTVVNLADAGAGSLRGQLAAAAPGDTIQFAPNLSGTLSLGSDLTLDRNLTILGNLDAAGNPLVTLSRGGADASMDLVINAGVTASASGLTFTGATGHALLNRGSLSLSSVAVTGNPIGLGGLNFSNYGTVYNSGTLIVRNSRITNNSVSSLDAGGGGGVWNEGGTLTIANSTLAYNQATGGDGGGIWSNGGTATITGSTIAGNYAGGGFGGGIGGTGSLTISACTIAGNQASIGGGIYGGNSVTSIVSGCTISNNTAQNGGGLYFGGNGWTLDSTTVDSNQSTGSGGGGIYVSQRSTVTVNNSTVAGNTANSGATPGAGGGIYVANGSLISSGGTLMLLGSTVANNQSSDGAGGGLWVGATRTQVSLTNTLLAGNMAATGGPDAYGPLLSTSGYNLIGNGDGSTGLADGTNGNQVGATASPIDPRLGPLQDNGGPTPTMALLAGSPAIDAGDNGNTPDHDQRGFARVVGAASDIGAVEVQSATQVTRLSISAPAGAVAGSPFIVTVQAVNDLGDAVPGFTVHFTSSDSIAVLPADYTFTATDPGTLTFPVTLKTAGTQSLTVAGATSAGSLTATSGRIVVIPAAAVTLRLSAPAATTAGQAVSVTVTLLDAYGNVATGYTGTVHFASSDASAALPANYTFTGADAGTHTFSVTLKKAGTQSITVSDTVTASLTATVGGIVVTPAAAKFVFTAPASVKRGAAFSLTLTVQDPYGNIVTGYTGTVRFTSSDGTAILPANYTFTAADAGVHMFVNQTILRKKGMQTLTVTDLATGTLTATVSIKVA